jgi:hypothetical protein
MPVPVTSYAAEWNPATNQGRVFVQIGGSQPVPVPIETPEEFTIMMLMMSKTGVQFDTQTKALNFPPRPVGT